MSESETKIKKGKGRHPKIVAVIPAYNEDRFVGSVVLKARKYVDAVIVVDDGSKDATGEIAEAAGAIVLRHEPNRGKGVAVNRGFHEARELGAEVVVLLDGDGQHRPEDIPKMTRAVIEGQADIVVGSRHLGAKSDIPMYRRLGQRAVTFLTNVGSGVPSTDSWSGYRALSHRALECIRFRENRHGLEPEWQFQAREHGLKVTEAPIVAIYEEKAKRNPFGQGISTVNAILRLVGQHRPLLFFSFTGLVILATGLATGLWVVDVYSRTLSLAYGSALISVLLCILGTLSLFTGVILHSVRGLVMESTRANRNDE